jgi:hypothetical protein
MPLDRTTEYTEYKAEIDRIHVMFRQLIKEGIPKGRPSFYVDKFLVDSYPIDDEDSQLEGIEGARKRLRRSSARAATTGSH